MAWSTEDEAFKVQLFRFIDVFPQLADEQAVFDHLREYFLDSGVNLPRGFGFALRAGSLSRRRAVEAMRSQIESIAGRFIAGVDVAEAAPGIDQRWRQGVATSIDLLGEACLSDREAQMYRQRYHDAIDQLAEAANGWPEAPNLETDHRGPIPRANVSIKLSALVARFDPVDFDASVDRAEEAVRPLLEHANERGVFVNFDMESRQTQALTLSVFERCLAQTPFDGGLAVQAYLKSGERDVDRLIETARRTGRSFVVRLVKGAYWDHEVIHATQRNWPVPVWSSKAQTDAAFERLAGRILEAAPKRPDSPGPTLAVGSHNARSLAAAFARAEDLGLDHHALEVQMLYGMAEGLKRAALERGWRVREYTPVGELIPGMAYLVRRLLENTSNQSWLLKDESQQAPAETLLADPAGQLQRPDAGSDAEATATGVDASLLTPGEVDGFINHPHRDFSDAGQREPFAEAMAKGAVTPVANDADERDVERALSRASGAAPEWAGESGDGQAARRIERLLAFADKLAQRRDALAALVACEAGKPWRDADGDVCEAIDFCRYYAKQAGLLFERRQVGRFLGELHEQWYEPRGVAAAISPWNFPLAICCGMTAAAWVTGNPVVVKPAEQTPAIASRMVELMHEAGVPESVVQLLAGEGEVVGRALVADPRVAVVAFTGSKAVGLEIVERASKTREDQGQSQVKRVVAEMGGKNAIVIDDSADLDQAVAGVVRSAFGYAGQKCSACSRAIVTPGVRARFVERLVEASRSLVCGPATDPSTDVPPLIDAAAAEKARRYIAIGEAEGQLALSVHRDGLASAPTLVGPHIVTGVGPEARVAREEIFAPVLAVLEAQTFEQALQWADALPYRLTGGVFSRTPSHLERARRAFRVGNLYLNREITGSLVAREPFGGFGLSGVGSKTGGEDYLKQFVVPRTVTENTERRGFSPSVIS